ncbi:MAG: ribosome assembly RNA-binding protein YhbY [Rhodospirillaceae bacterium]
MELTPAQRRALRAKAHHLSPVVIIGDAGLTPAVLNEIDVHLRSHELIKVKVQEAEREQRAGIADDIASALDAAVVQKIGKTLVMYRPRPEDASAAASKARPRRKPPRRTKRSYQMS